MMETSPDINTVPKNYFKREIFILKACGISLKGNESLAYKIYSNFLIYFLILPYIIVTPGDLFKLELAGFLEQVVYIGGVYMAISVTTVTFFNRLQLGKLLKKLVEKQFLPNTERGGDLEETLINDWLSFKGKQNMALCGSITVVCIYRNICILLNRLRSDDYHDWTFGYGTITIINATYSPNYEILCLYQIIVVSYIGIISSLIIVMVASTLAYISVQFQMLQNNLRRIVPISSNDMLKDTPISPNSPSTLTEIDPSTIPWKYLEISLKNVTLYHLDIIDIAKGIEEIFSNTIFFVCLCAFGMFCSEVFRTSLLPINDPSMGIQLLETLATSMHSLLLCYGGQRMTDESFNVANAAYEANFVGADLRFQKGLMLIIRRSQKPLIIKAGKFMEMAMYTYAWIIRTAYSTCMILRRVQRG